MSYSIPRVCAVHDLSGVGRCALTVIMPVLSVMNAQVCPLPTAILSTHTGGFGSVSLQDCTDYMPSVIRHWSQEQISFDCIYSGFLCSMRQIDIVSDFIKDTDAFRVIDPVMADHGIFYKNFTSEMCAGIRQLCAYGDLITPNITEALFLLNRPYCKNPQTDVQAKELLRSLSLLGSPMIVITGVPTPEGAANFAYDAKCSQYWKVPYPVLPVSYPGTGDIFTSVLIGSLLSEDPLPIAMGRAAHFVSLAMQATLSRNLPIREGVLLEPTLPSLLKKTNLYSYVEI